MYGGNPADDNNPGVATGDFGVGDFGHEPSAGGADAYDASNTGIYGAQAPMGNVSIVDAIASALGLGQPAKQTQAFPAGQSMAKSLTDITPGRALAKFGTMLLGGDLTPRGVMTTDTHNFMQQNQFMEQDPSLFSNYPTDPYAEESRANLISAALAGSGPQQGLASAVENIGGIPVNVGPSLIMDPGETNPINQMMFQGGADYPFRRKERNIAQMVGGV
jgi:hypothetical protein